MKRIVFILFFCTLLFSCEQKPVKPLVLNEICGKEFPDNEWIEIYNPTDNVVQLKGYYLIKIDEDGIDYVIYKFKGGQLGPNQVLVVSSLQKQLRRGLSRKKELGVELVAPDDQTVDDFYRDEEVGEHAHPTNGSYARIPNGTGAWAVVKHASRGELNPKDAETVDEGLSDLGEETGE